MPFYEYECSNCRYYSEVLQKITDKPLKKCPSCGKNTFKKLISAPVFRLKGAGWYETDFKTDKDNKRNLVGADKDEAPAKTETAVAATDGKTAAAADGKADGKADEPSGCRQGRRQERRCSCGQERRQGRQLVGSCRPQAAGGDHAQYRGAPRHGRQERRGQARRPG